MWRIIFNLGEGLMTDIALSGLFPGVNVGTLALRPAAFDGARKYCGV
jgi:hypothetical protein